MKEKYKFSKYILIVLSLCFVAPSIVYLVKNKTVFNFNGDLEYCFLLTNNINRLYQAFVFAIIILAFIAIYYFIIKNRNKIFDNIKQVYSFVFVVSIIFIFAMPFWCSDIFYYLGIGRLASTYNQNPYYIDIKNYVDDNNIDMQKDTVLHKGYNNYWSETTVVYGAFWTLICSVISFLSFGNLDIGLLLFKIINLFVHIGNCILLYKISKKKIFSLLYGLNPFVLIEGIANVHNDIFVVFFMLLSLFMLLKKKRIIFSVLFLSIATGIKYFSILLLPFIVIYYYKDKDVKTRILKCIQYGLIFAVFLMIPYLLYIKDINVFLGLSEQRNRIAKGLYLFISEYFNNPSNLVDILKNSALFAFSVLYIWDCFALLLKKEIKFNEIMRKLFKYIIVFLFFLITNFQPWYFMWLIPVIIWQKAKNINLIIQMQLMTLIANIVFLIYSENYRYGIPFFIILVIGILTCIIKYKNDLINRRSRIVKKYFERSK